MSLLMKRVVECRGGLFLFVLLGLWANCPAGCAEKETKLAVLLRSVFCYIYKPWKHNFWNKE